MPKQAMSSKQKRMMEAARLHYMEDLNLREVSERMSVSYDTVRRYFTEDEMEQFQRFYSDQELFKLQQSLEQDIKDGEDLANNLLARAIQHEDAKPSTLARASKLALENRKRKVELLQELGIIKKPKERKEVEQKGSEKEEKFAERLQEAYQELEQGEEVEPDAK
jgi:DNA-binding transcriptional regulator LsrR (DeoR family)